MSNKSNLEQLKTLGVREALHRLPEPANYRMHIAVAALVLRILSPVTNVYLYCA